MVSWNFIKKYIFDPKVTLYIFSLFLVIYIYFLYNNNAFSDEFLNFGPCDKTKFLSMKIDTWDKVYMLWIIGFTTAFFTNYYRSVNYDFVFSKIWNPAYKKKLSISKPTASVLMFFDPILNYITLILNLFVNLTMKLQFILPGFIGMIFAKIPYAYYKLEEKNKQFCIIKPNKRNVNNYN